jgi:hypothetical protein
MASDGTVPAARQDPFRRTLGNRFLLWFSPMPVRFGLGLPPEVFFEKRTALQIPKPSGFQGGDDTMSIQLEIR